MNAEAEHEIRMLTKRVAVLEAKVDNVAKYAVNLSDAHQHLAAKVTQPQPAPQEMTLEKDRDNWRQWCGEWRERAERAEAELAKERATANAAINEAQALRQERDQAIAALGEVGRAQGLAQAQRDAALSAAATARGECGKYRKVVEMVVSMGDEFRIRSPSLGSVIVAARDALSSSPPPARGETPSESFDFLAHLQRQREWSERTFGPGSRAAGVVDHIRKELREIEAMPNDLEEWIDVVILALDGAWRSGASPQQIIEALVNKQSKNQARQWPDWRTAHPGKAIEHVREPTPPQPSPEQLVPEMEITEVGPDYVVARGKPSPEKGQGERAPGFGDEPYGSANPDCKEASK